MRIFFFIISLFLFCNCLRATVVTIEGSASDYAGKELAFYRYIDHISMTEEKLASFKVAWNGDFQVTINVDRIVYGFIYLGKIKGFLYIEPGKSYKLKLPPFTNLSEEEKLNPYFKHEEVYLFIIEPEDESLNKNIVNFDQIYGEYFAENMINFYRKRKPTDFNLFVDSVNTVFADVHNGFVGSYIRNRLAYLSYFATPHKVEDIFVENLIAYPVELDNPSYMSLLREIALPYFDVFNKKNKSEGLYDFINQTKDIFKIKNKLSILTEISNDKLLEVWLMQVVYSAYYKNALSLSVACEILFAISQNSVDIKLVEMADAIARKLTNLRAGTQTPDFSLLSYKGDSVSLSKFNKKYVYLNFCTFDSYACQNDFAVMKNLYEKHKDKIEIISICIDKNIEANMKIIKKEKYKWTFLAVDDTQKILQLYNIHVYPTYFLISPDGYLDMAPAPSPREDFEFHFFKVWEAARFQKQRDAIDKD